jgi:hypothetical protein
MNRRVMQKSMLHRAAGAAESSGIIQQGSIREKVYYIGPDLQDEN